MSFEELRGLWTSGTVDEQSLYWHAGMPEWAPLANIARELGPAQVAAPPELGPRPSLPRGVHPPSPPPPTSGLAIASFVLGIIAPLFCITGIPAIICGHMARSEIRRSHGAIGGEGFATAGLVLGYMATLLMVLAGLAIMAGIALPLFAVTKDQAKITQCSNNARQIGLACKEYAQDHDGKYPNELEELVPAYLPDRSLLLCPFAAPHAKRDATYILLARRGTDRPDAPLLRAPYGKRNGERVVIRTDMSLRWEHPTSTPLPSTEPIEAEN